MGNLGSYQWVTTVSKKVGGPFQLLGIVAIGGYAVFRGMEAGGKYFYKLVKKKSNGASEKLVNAIKFKVKTEGISNEGVHFDKGDEFFVLETDDEAVLIDKIGDPNAPYFISKDFLYQILSEGKETIK